MPSAENSFAYERNLGHIETLESHQWKEIPEAKCQICNKKTLCLFVWNARMADKAKSCGFWEETEKEPIKLKTAQAYDYPVLCSSDGQVVKMLSMDKFLPRMMGITNCKDCHQFRDLRNTNNERENDKFDRVKLAMSKDFNNNQRFD